MPGRHRRDPDRRAGRGGGGHDPPEERVARLVGGQHGERREHGRLVEHDLRRIDEGDLRDQRQERLPEREGVARVEPAVGELVHGRQVQVAELDELAGAGEVEEAVAADLAGDVPEQQAEHGPASPDRTCARGSRAPSAAGRANGAATSAATRSSTSASVSEACTAKTTVIAAKTIPSPQASVADVLRTPDRPRGDRARREHETGRDREPDQQEDRAHRSISERTSPVPSQRAASRYIAPFSPRTILPRSDGCGAEQRPDALRLGEPVVLEEEPHVAAQVVTVEPAAVRGAAHVHALRLRREERLPARLREAVAASRPPR